MKNCILEVVYNKKSLSSLFCKIVCSCHLQVRMEREFCDMGLWIWSPTQGVEFNLQSRS
jgi:hypothetical protein